MLRIGQVESSATADGTYTDGNVAGGIAATRLRAAAFNAIQEELAHIVESTGVDLDVNDMTQVLTALKSIFTVNTDSMGALAALVGAANKLPYFTGPKDAALADLTAFAREILAQTDAAGVLSKLGLGGVSSGMFPIGMPFYWPSATMPNLLLPEWSGMTFLKWNGATFSATAYPKLALVIPSLTLTESRGEFIRNWDDGRGIDSGRTLLSSQLDAMQVITGTFATDNVSGTIPPTGAFYNAGTSTAGMTNDTNGMTMGFDSSKVARTSTETRSRNIAFNFLVRAA